MDAWNSIKKYILSIKKDRWDIFCVIFKIFIIIFLLFFYNFSFLFFREKSIYIKQIYGRSKFYKKIYSISKKISVNIFSSIFAKKNIYDFSEKKAYIQGIFMDDRLPIFLKKWIDSKTAVKIPLLKKFWRKRFFGKMKNSRTRQNRF